MPLVHQHFDSTFDCGHYVSQYMARHWKRLSVGR